MMAIETITGKKTKLVLVSQNKGAIRVPLAQSLDYSPRFSSKNIFEFDNLNPALTLAPYEGSDVRFDYIDSGSKLVDAAVNDLAPNSSPMIDDPASYSEIQIFANSVNDANKIHQSVLISAVKIKGSAVTIPVVDESRITRDGEASSVLRCKGVGIEYVRARTSATTAYIALTANGNLQADTVTAEAAGSSTFSLTNTPLTIPNTSPSVKYLIALLNGTNIKALDAPPTVGISALVVTITPQLTASDVFEIFTVYTPV